MKFQHIKAFLWIALLILCQCAHVPPQSTLKPAVQRLTDELNYLFSQSHFSNAHWGVAIRSLETGEFLYLRNENKGFMPASNLKQLEPFKEKRIFKVLERWFNKIPFAMITFVGFTPVPHLPFRLMAVLTNYSIVRYAFASFVGRAAFYYLVALTGGLLSLPYWVYIIFLSAMILLVLVTKIVRSCGRILNKREALQ